MEERLFFCEKCEKAAVAAAPVGTNCPDCHQPMESSVLDETANLPTLTFLAALLLAGWIGDSFEVKWLKYAGWGVPLSYFLASFFFKGNLRWIFTRWVAASEPGWYSKKLMADWRDSFWSGLLMENISGMILFVVIAIAGTRSGADVSKVAAQGPQRASAQDHAVSLPGDLYRDRKNGYFSVLAPNGWTRQDFDDTRTKVAWRLPSDSRVMLSIIVRQATADLAQVREDARKTSQNFRSRGFSVEEGKGEIAGVAAVVTTVEHSGFAVSRIWLFVTPGLHFNVMFAAPSRALFEGSLAVVKHSLDTVLPLPQKGPNAKQAAAEELAWYKRFAMLLGKLGDAEAGREIAREGLRKYPNDADLKAAAQPVR